ncbi:hypothetical protein UA08_03298 [Talaromyces atroroseus]|uniref:Uncharacterized protein n=1 Tax=Talaromyces atroroseus TaxID=1441469 RepID=A0A225B677_TALAT|nr:hypothetical protein UA08_03298 [Talaromyces atroroseus]OKL61407.1 hypothetical protein UA08_03298 [Talaromyces atroroseus]
MEVDIFFKLPDEREFMLKVLNSLTIGELITIVKNKTEHYDIILTCAGAPLPPGKSLEELDIRSGYVFGIESDWESRVKAIEEKAKGLAKSSTLPLRFLLPARCSMIRGVETGPIQLAEHLLKEIQKVHLNASDISQKRVLGIFSIGVSRELFTVPERTLENFQDLLKAGYDENNEPYSRLRIDILMIPAMIQIRQNSGIPYQSSDLIQSKKRKRGQNTPRKDLKMFFEYELQTEITDPETNTTYVLTGRADWAAGHSERGTSDSVLVCVEAKRSDMFSTVEAQLTAYLAICRHERLIAEKHVVAVQGFGSDGDRFLFQILTSDRILYQSKIYDTRDKNDLEVVYNFMIYQLEAAIHLSPTCTPVKGSQVIKKRSVKEKGTDLYSKFGPLPIIDEGTATVPDDVDFKAYLKSTYGSKY